MKTLLIVLEDQAKASMYEYLARAAGIKIVLAEGALHALTQLERIAVNAIICDAQMSMTSAEFRSILQEDPRTSQIPVYVLPDPHTLHDQPQFETALSGPELLEQVFAKLDVPTAHFPVPVSSVQQPQLQGDLREFALQDFLNWVAEMKFFGHWLVRVQDAQGHKQTGHLAVQEGNVIYAEFHGLTGKKAVMALLRAIERHQQSQFWFYKTTPTQFLRSHDLNQSTARLLIEVAVDLDHLHNHPIPSAH